MKNQIHTWAIILFTATFSTFSVKSLAQDAHYWTQHYGTRSMLLSNSVIGGVQDLGAVYYNPARLGLIENPAFLLNAQVYEWNHFKIKRAFSEDASVTKSDFGGLPSLVAGTFKVSFLKNHHFAYALLLRQQLDADLNYKEEVFGDVLENFPGEESFGGYIRINQKSKQQWASLTWSYPFSDHLSIGVTTNAVIIDQKKGNQIELQALSEIGDVAIYRFNRSFDMENYGILWKVGLAADIGKVHTGLTIKTPVISVFGNGKYQFEQFFSGIKGYSTSEDYYATSNQKDLSTNYHAPWAIGIGITVPINRNKLHFSGEWYSNIQKYTMMQAADHYGQSHGDTIQFRLVDQLNSVANFGIGTELYLSQNVSGYLSFSTDYSAAPANITAFSDNKPETSNSVFSADFYHLAGGFVFTFPKSDITIGVAHTGCRQDFARPVNFPKNRENSDEIFNPNDTATLKWDRWRLVFGLSVPFLKNIEDRLKGKGN